MELFYEDCDSCVLVYTLVVVCLTRHIIAVISINALHVWALQTRNLLRTDNYCKCNGWNMIHNVGMVKAYNKYVIIRTWKNIDTR